MKLSHRLPEKKSKYLILAVIVLLAVGVRCVFFSGGIRGSDAYAYAQYAYDISSNAYYPGDIADHFGFRYTVLLPTALSYALFGVNDFSSSFFIFLASIANILIIFKIGEKLYDVETAFLAGTLLAFYPLDVLGASFLGPDSFTPFLSSLAIFCYLKGLDNSHRIKRVFFFIVVGTIIGIAVGARETSIFLLGVLFLFHVFKRRSPTHLLWILAGFGVPVIAEMIYYYIAVGSPFLRFEILDQLKILIRNDYQESAGSLLYYPRMMFGFNLQGLATYGLIWWFTALGLILAYIKKDNRNLLPGIWVVLPFLGFEFGLQSFKEMILISKNYNYLALITPPVMLLSAYFLNQFFKARYFTNKRTLYLPILLLCLISMNLYGTYRVFLNVRDDAAPYVTVANYLKKAPKKTIYIHHGRWPLFLNYFLRYDPLWQFRNLDETDEENRNNIANAYVIIHKRYVEADVIGRPFKQLPDYARYVDNPPSTWERVLTFSGNPPYNDVCMYYAK